MRSPQGRLAHLELSFLESHLSCTWLSFPHVFQAKTCSAPPMFLPRDTIGALPLFKVGLTRTRRTESGLRVFGAKYCSAHV
jgi:hypothetical protein